MDIKERQALREELSQINRMFMDAVGEFTNNPTEENAVKIKALSEKQQLLSEKYWAEYFS